MYHYTYKTTNNITGKYYFGMHSTTNLDDRYLGSGLKLKASVKKYGRENFTNEILEYYETRELLSSAEKILITEETLKDPLCMNLCCAGGGHNASYGNKGIPCSYEKRIKLSIANKNSNHMSKEYIVITPKAEVVEIINLKQFSIENMKNGLIKTS